MNLNKKNIYNAYADLARNSLSKTKQVILLYETAIKKTENAIKAIEEGNIQARYNNITEAVEILRGLQLSLDMENGKDVSKLLYDFYSGADARLMAMHVNPSEGDETALKYGRATKQHLITMRDAWKEVEQIVNQDEEGGKNSIATEQVKERDININDKADDKLNSALSSLDEEI